MHLTVIVNLQASHALTVAAQAVLSLLQSIDFPGLSETAKANQSKLDCMGSVAAFV